MVAANEMQADPAAAPRSVLIVDTEPALSGLLQEWLAECGYSAVDARSAGNQHGFDLVIVDIPFPRQGASERVARLNKEHPGIPIVALSSCIFSGIKCRGEVAHTLGVASVLPKPVPREALQSAVRNLFGD